MECRALYTTKIVQEVNLILNLLKSFLNKIIKKLEVLHECSKKGLGKGLSALFGDIEKKQIMKKLKKNIIRNFRY